MKQNIAKYTFSGLIGFMMLGFAGCSEDVDFPMPSSPEVVEGETVEVPLSFSIGSGWEIDADQTRATPPGLGGNNPGTTTPDDDLLGYEEIEDVDKVQVYTFRRRVREVAPGETVSADDLRFSYDASNSQILDLVEDMIDSGEGRYEYDHKHKYTKDGKLKKVYGYEYKVVALAYSSTRESAFDKKYLNLDKSSTFDCKPGEHNRFTVPVIKNGREIYLDEFEAQVNVMAGIKKNTNGWTDFYTGHTSYNALQTKYSMDKLGYKSSESIDVVETPQLFFGTCKAHGVADDVIRFSETDTNGDDQKELPVEGILYRGVAKIELHVIPTAAKPPLGTTYSIDWVALLSDNIASSVGFTDYDDFLNPTYNLTAGKYRPISYLDVNEKVGAPTSDDIKKWGDTQKKENEKVITAYVLPGKMRLAIRVKTNNLTALGATHSIKNGQLLAKKDVDTPGGNATGVISPDYHDGIFYLRRNHKYVLTVYDTEGVINNKKNPL